MKKLYTTLFLLLISSLTLFAQTETEPNDNINQGSNSGNTFTASATNTLAIGATITVANNDFYKINLPSCGSWAFNIINDSGQGVVNVKFYNAQNITTGQILNSNFNFNDGLPTPVVINCGQTIWVQVDQTSGADIGAYKLEVSQYTTENSYECNNDFDSASLLPNINTSFKAKIFGYDCSGNNDLDWYKITPNECGVLRFNITSVALDQKLVIQVWNSTQTKISEIIGSTGTNVSLATLLSSGTYYIRVYDYYGYLINDPLSIDITFDTTDTYECNNRFEDASLISLEPNVTTTITPDISGINAIISNGSIISNTDFDEDQDWYKITPNECGVLRFNITSVALNQKLVIQVWNSTQTKISEIIGSTGSSVSLATLLSSGTFYIRVWDYYGYLINDPLSIDITFDTTDTYECNNRFEDASLISLEPNVTTTITPDISGINAIISNGSIISNTDFDEDQDWYKITPTQCGVLNFNITSVALDQKLVIQVWNSAQTKISEIIGSTGSSVSLATLLSSGTFYIRVWDYYGYLINDPLSIAVTFLTTPVVTQVGTTYSTIQTASSQSNTYQWYRNGILISGANSSSYTSSLAGPYTVCISNAASCSTCSANLSNESFEQTVLSVYPNPTHSVLKLQFDTNTAIDKVIIIDMTGKKLLEQTENDAQINVESLANGTYLIEVLSENKKFQSKFIKE